MTVNETNDIWDTPQRELCFKENFRNLVTFRWKNKLLINILLLSLKFRCGGQIHKDAFCHMVAACTGSIITWKVNVHAFTYFSLKRGNLLFLFLQLSWKSMLCICITMNSINCITLHHQELPSLTYLYCYVHSERRGRIATAPQYICQDHGVRSVTVTLFIPERWWR